MFNRFLQRQSENEFIKNLGWLGVSEIVVRITRLITAIVLARTLDSTLFGLAALVLTVNELIRVFNRNGIGAKIVECDANDLEQICNTAYRLNIIFCLGLFGLQCLVAYPLAQFYDTPALVPMLQVLSITYLLMPVGMVQAALIQREQRINRVALIDGGQVALDNVLTAILALAGCGAWAIVLPKFLTSPIWVFGYRLSHPWRPSGTIFCFSLWRDLLKFGRYFLSIELLKTARLNVDNMIIGRVLGIEALGLYYFARNAGLGFSLAFINAINAALYPNLCAVSNKPIELKARFARNLKQITFIALPFISLQAGLAFIYVPIIFGTQWAPAIPILTLLCLSALPRPFAESASALALAAGRIDLDFKWNVIFSVVFVVSVALAASTSLLCVASTIFVLYIISHPIYLAVVWRKIFNDQACHSKSRDIYAH